MGGPGRERGEPLRLPAFRTFWAASTAGFLGLSLTTVAVDVLVIEELAATEVEVGVVRAAQVAPYLLVGLVAGALVDRWRRRPTLVVTNLAQAALLLLLPVLAWVDALSLAAVAAVLLVAGSFAVFAAAAEQSLLPDLVPRRALVVANARLGQSTTVAQSAGPPLAGALVAGLGVAAGLLAGGLTRVVAALLVARTRVEEEPASHDRPRLTLRRDVADGIGFVYRHRVLAPLAVSTHVWFLANSIALTVLGLFVLRGLGLGAAGYGLVLAAVGVGGFAGALVAPWLGRRLGEGDAVVLGRLLCTVAWAATPLAPQGDGDLTLAYLCAVQLLYGVATGLEDPNEMGYWQASTPRGLLGRVNATRRSANRSVAVVGALLGGVLAAGLGYRGTLLVGAGVFLLATAVVAFSPLRGARAE